MFPIRDHNPSDRAPLVTYALIAANIVMFLLTLPYAGPDSAARWEQLALYPALVSDGHPLPGLLSHMFLHAGLLHLAGNMLFLWIFGDNLEDQMGHLPYLAFYLTCGLAAAGAQILSDPDSVVPMVGASGAIAGVMGGYLLMFPRARVDVIVILLILVRRFTIPAWVTLGAWFALQVGSVWAAPAAEGGVAYWAHSGGFVAGLVLTVPLFLRRGGARFWNRTGGHPPHTPRQYPTRFPQIRR
ncbi:rhomboid family intramembrane serine protease [Paracoccus jiaweipingae]|uniref:rhomboid family intramembrane serine protease n=1 Tax=unclassified Paracoccus (in: a-proteobacteria) TaxID=2688777 RepID=UPI0037B0C07C